MKRILFFQIVFALLLLLHSTGAKGQFVWQSTLPSEEWRYTQTLTALSCFDNTCTVFGFVWDKITNEFNTPFFWKSKDGALTWEVINPGRLPLPLNPNARNYVLQQIDENNIVLVGELGLIVRTIDGGKTWEVQESKTTNLLTDVHFSDTQSGIITCGDPKGTILTTTNGGRQWNAVSIGRSVLQSCYSYGNGKFSVFKRGRGRIYTTINNWTTIDSSATLVDSTTDSSWTSYFFLRCKFSGGDTVIAHGFFQSSNPAIVRSTDRGNTWEKPTSFPIPLQVTHMTPLNRDTLYASGYLYDRNKILFSSDMGKQWRVDSLVLDTSYTIRETYGLDRNRNNNVIAVFDKGAYIYTDSLKLSVLSNIRIVYNSAIYPNPASTDVAIATYTSDRPLQLVDLLGRVVFRGSTSSNGIVNINVSSLARGIYTVIVDRGGVMFPVGKLAVAGER